MDTHYLIVLLSYYDKIYKVLFMTLDAWGITWIVIASILAAYLLLVLVDVMFVLSFRALLRKHIVALNVLLQTKYDNLKTLLNVISKYDDNLDPRYLETLNGIDIKHLAKPHTKEGGEARRQLSFLRDELIYEAARNESLKKHEEFLRAKQHIDDLDQIYYVQISTYNADVIGYNYWIRFVPTRYIYKLLRIKKKEIIS